MSRFLVNQSDESEEEVAEQLPEIKEEPEIDTQKMENDQNEEAAEQNEDIEDNKNKKKRKKKVKDEEPKVKKSAISTKISKIAIEKRKAETEKNEKFRSIFFDIVNDLRTMYKTDLKEFAAQYNKRILAKRKKQELKEAGIILSKKERLEQEKNKLALENFKQMMGNAETAALPNPVGKTKLKKKRLLKEKNNTNNANEDDLSNQNNEISNQNNLEDKKDIPEGVDEWELLVEEVSKVEEDKPINENQNIKATNAPKNEKEKNKDLKDKTSQDTKNDKNKTKEDTIINKVLSTFNFTSYNRCPVICIMGHVDTGKTKLLDKIRGTNVQTGEAGGITQQIGASFFPEQKLMDEIAKVSKKILNLELKIPGLLIIDTPGHESFSNLRSRGSSLCDLAIVVVDIMHGLENQTRESIQMLINKKTPFVIALNKIDRIFQWVSKTGQSSYISYSNQTDYVKGLFRDQLMPVMAELAKMYLNASLYWENEDPTEYIHIIPTSAITGEGIPDLLAIISQYSQTYLTEKIVRNFDEFKATVMEVKKTEGHGATLDLMLMNGELKEGDKVVLSGFEGPIVTTIKSLLTPPPLREMRVKSELIHHKKVVGSIGVRVVAPGLELAISGSAFFKYNNEEELEMYCEELQDDIKKIKKTIKLSSEGVGVAASSLGSLEALLVYLRENKIPVSTVCIGDVCKNDLLKVLSPFLAVEDVKSRKKEYLTMLCFDVKILEDALKFAADNHIKIIPAKIIYHLTDEFFKYMEVIKTDRKKEAMKKAVFPCIVKPVQVFNKKDPIVLGVDVLAGVLKIGTPLCVPTKDKLKVGIVESIEANHKPLTEAMKKHGSVAIKIKNAPGILFGRQLDIEDELVSMLTRESIDCLKEHFREEVDTAGWNLVRSLKPMFNL